MQLSIDIARCHYDSRPRTRRCTAYYVHVTTCMHAFGPTPGVRLDNLYMSCSWTTTDAHCMACHRPYKRFWQTYDLYTACMLLTHKRKRRTGDPINLEKFSARPTGISISLHQFKTRFVWTKARTSMHFHASVNLFHNPIIHGPAQTGLFPEVT